MIGRDGEGDSLGRKCRKQKFRKKGCRAVGIVGDTAGKICWGQLGLERQAKGTAFILGAEEGH